MSEILEYQQRMLILLLKKKEFMEYVALCCESFLSLSGITDCCRDELCWVWSKRLAVAVIMKNKLK